MVRKAIIRHQIIGIDSTPRDDPACHERMQMIPIHHRGHDGPDLIRLTVLHAYPGDPEAIDTFLNRPHPLLDGQTPFDMTRS